MGAGIGSTTPPLADRQRAKHRNGRVVRMSEAKSKHTKRNPLGDETEASAMRCTVGTYDKRTSAAAWGTEASGELFPAHASDGCVTGHGYGASTPFQTRSLGGVALGAACGGAHNEAGSARNAASGLRAMWRPVLACVRSRRQNSPKRGADGGCPRCCETCNHGRRRRRLSIALAWGDDLLQQRSLMKRSRVQDHGRRPSRGGSEGRTNQGWAGLCWRYCTRPGYPGSLGGTERLHDARRPSPLA